jgi:hypothetical protein
MKTVPAILNGVLAFAMSVAFLGCGGGDSTTDTTQTKPYDDGKTVVIGGKGGPSTFDSGQGAQCIDVGNGVCISAQKECGDGKKADVIVNGKGEVIDIVCYPSNTHEEVDIDNGPIKNDKNDNKNVYLLDNKDDGVDVTGDVEINGNNVVVFGYGPDVSVIGGNLSIPKNDSIVRGVRVKGNVKVTGNNVKIVFCAIEGTLTIEGNNATIAGCDLFGDIKLVGQNAVFVYNRIQKFKELSGNGLVCNDNTQFEDKDKNNLVSTAELGGPVACKVSP